MNLLPIPSDPHRSLEEAWVDEYLRAHGCSREKLRGLPPDDARALLAEATRAAAERLTEIECRMQWLQGIHHR